MGQFPLVRQKIGSRDCLRCCALMVFRFFEDDISKTELWKRLHVYQKHSGLYGSYDSDLGVLALKRGYKPTIFHHDTSWWEKRAMEAKTNSSLTEALHKLKKDKKDWAGKKEVEKEIAYLQKGGKYKIRLPRLEHIDFYLHRKIPVILNVFGYDLYKSPSENYRHFILVIGKKGNNYVVRDPYLAYNKIEAETLEYIWSRGGGWMMVVEPGEKRAKVKQESLKF